jgi:hypothetical protein
MSKLAGSGVVESEKSARRSEAPPKLSRGL